MPLSVPLHQITATVFWPARGCIQAGKIIVAPDAPRHHGLEFEWGYESVLRVADVALVASGWTKTSLAYRQPFNGDESAFNSWCKTDNGLRRVLDEIIRHQSHFIDHLKRRHPHHQDASNIRHFGPAEWPFWTAQTTSGEVISVLNPAARAEVAAAPLALDLDANAMQKPVPFVARTILRACDLVCCGYPTEAVLTAIAVLDATVQNTLVDAMKSLGVQTESAKALLRNTTTSRLATYLDPVLKLVTNRSLAEDDSALFEKLRTVNGRRNNAIHNGVELTRSESQEALVVIYDVLDYVRTTLSPSLDLPPRPSFGVVL